LIWLAIISGEMSLPTSFVPARWHTHEMLFGFAAAAVAGFMLTAIPNGQAYAAARRLPDNTLCYMVAWSSCGGNFRMGREHRFGDRRSCVSCCSTRNRASRNHCRSELAQSAHAGRPRALARGKWLDSLIPSFTRNWLVKQGRDLVPAPFERFDVVTLLFVLGALALWSAIPQSALAGLALIGAGVLSFVRLTRWRTLSIFRNQFFGSCTWVMDGHALA
jgi:uncharacterized protein involved in response to NO